MALVYVQGWSVWLITHISIMWLSSNPLGRWSHFLQICASWYPWKMLWKFRGNRGNFTSHHISVSDIMSDANIARYMARFCIQFFFECKWVKKCSLPTHLLFRAPNVTNLLSYVMHLAEMQICFSDTLVTLSEHWKAAFCLTDRCYHAILNKITKRLLFLLGYPEVPSYFVIIYWIVL